MRADFDARPALSAGDASKTSGGRGFGADVEHELDHGVVLERPGPPPLVHVGAIGGTADGRESDPFAADPDRVRRVAGVEGEFGRRRLQRLPARPIERALVRAKTIASATSPP